MAALEVISLPSSPPRMPLLVSDAFKHNMSSSPGLPSPSQIAHRKSQSRSGSRAAAIPSHVSGHFTSAGSLWRQESADQGPVDEALSATITAPGIEEPKLKTAPRAKAVRKPRVSKKDQETVEVAGTSVTLMGDTAGLKGKCVLGAGKDSCVGHEFDSAASANPKQAAKDLDFPAEVKKPRKPRAKKAGTTLADDAEEKKKKAIRAAKPKVDDSAVQTKIARGRITKSSNAEPKRKATASKRSATVSSHFAPIVNDTIDLTHTPIDDRLFLKDAARRRCDWTPPKVSATACPADPLDATDGSDENRPISSTSESDAQTARKSFSNLFGSFAYQNESLTIVAASKDTGTAVVVKKRKLIELVKTNAPPVAAPVPKEKKMAMKKKARTITGLATAAYENAAEEASPVPLLQYFTLDSPAPNSFKKPGKPRNKSPVKGSSRLAKGMTVVAAEHQLMSPESALNQARRQEFVFGTSSQLAREDSPTLLRDLHMAMLASNQDEDPFTDVDVGSSAKPSEFKRPSLWAAASFADEDAFTDIDALNLVDAPAIARYKEDHQSREAKSLASHVSPELSLPCNSAAENMPTAPPVGSEGSSTRTSVNLPGRGPIEAAIRLQLSSSPGLKSHGNNSHARAYSTSTPPTKEKKSLRKPKPVQKPDFATYTDAQLAKEIRSYHFKPVKSRVQMIKLLEKCWEGKQQIALGNLGTNPIQSPSPKTKSHSHQEEEEMPRKPRGRPRKDGMSKATATAKSPTKCKRKTVPVIAQENDADSDSDIPLSSRRTPSKRAMELPEEISNSDTPSTPSPPRRRPSQIRSPPLPLELSAPDASAEAKAEAQSAGAGEALLHKHITLAIKSAPIATDAQKPSWHEKILMYDPIVLEDLTTWLNTGALEKVGWDGEVDPKDVKKWCWARSVCCLWRENLRGGARARW